jgi:precorrin-4 methylase
MQIDFTIEQLSVLDKAIQQLPYYVAAPLIAHINKEIEKQKQVMDTPVSVAEMDRAYQEWEEGRHPSLADIKRVA